MGPELGQLHYELWNDLAWIHAKWKQYRQLFATSDDTIAILNKTAPSFFYFSGSILFDDVLLHIARLTDPPDTGGRTNLTLQRLPPAVAEAPLRGTTESLLQQVLEQTAFARDRRNRRIAHRDLLTARGLHPNPLAQASRQDVENALRAMRELMNVVEMQFENSTTAYEAFIGDGGGDALVAWLRRGLDAFDDEQRRGKGGS
jgi:hypothetical protein